MLASLKEKKEPMKFIRTLLNKISKLCYWSGLTILFAIIIGILLAFIYDPYGLSIDSCLDDKKVWDYAENRCREDCYTWKEKFGCIQLTKEQIVKLKRCNYNIQYCDNGQLYVEVCLNNHKSWNVKTKDCMFEFKLEDCFKLKGDWKYPDECINLPRNANT